MATFSVVDKVISVYNWFKATSLGYPIRKLEKAIPDLILGLRHDDSRKPVSRNATVILSAAIGYLFGILTPLVFAPKLMSPLVHFAKSILKPIGLQVAAGSLAGIGVFLFASLFAVLTIHLSKALYGLLFSQSTQAGRLTNHGMIIPENKKQSLAADIQAQIRFEKPRARFGVAQLNSYANVIQERYVKFRDLSRDFDSNSHARSLAAESLISSRSEARAELAKAKLAMNNLRNGDWLAVDYYFKTLETERTNQRAYYESQRQRIENLQQHLRLDSDPVLGEEGPIQLGPDPSHLSRDETLSLLRHEVRNARADHQTNPPFFGWLYSHKNVIPLNGTTQEVDGVEEAKAEIQAKIDATQGRTLRLPSL